MSERIYGIKENKSLMDITPSLEASAIIRDSGETINFTGLKSNIPVQVEGATEQAKYNGYQLFDPTNIYTRSACVEEFKGNTLTQTVTSAGTARQIAYLIGSADYFNGKSITLSLSKWERNHENVSMIGLVWRTSAGTYISDSFNIKYPELTKTTVLNKPENAGLLGITIQICRQGETGAVGDYTKYVGLTVYEGTESKSWEPYTGMKPSPNIHYPQDIYAIGDRGNLDVTCKQGSDVHTLSIPLSRPLYSIGGLTEEITKNESGRWGVQRFFDRVIFDGSADEGWRSVSTVDDTKFRQCTSKIKDSVKTYGNSISFKGLCNCFIVSNASNLWNCIHDGIAIDVGKDLVIYSNEYNTNDPNPWKNFISENPMEVVYELAEPVWEQLPDDTQKLFNSFTSFDGENVVSTTDETTVKYRGVLNTAGAISDSFTMQNGQVGVLRKVGKVIFDGSDDENWTTVDTSGVVDYLVSSNKVASLVNKPFTGDFVQPISCSAYVTRSYTSISYREEGIGLYSDGSIGIYDPDYNTSDVSLWKTHLSSAPMTVYYELATPVFEPLDGFLKPKLTIDYAQTPYGADVLNMLAGGGSGGGGSIEPDANGNMAIGNYTDFGNGANNLTIGANAHVTPGSVMSVHVGTDSGRYNKGSRNMGLGYGTLMGKSGGANTAHRNVAIGLSAARDADNMSSSVYIGAYCGEQATGGVNNTYIGAHAGKMNTSEGQNNVGIGANSLTVNTEGLWNVAIGSGALRANTTGDNNMAIGGAALAGNVAGFGNTGIGTSALFANTNGNNNVAIGGFALSDGTALSNNVAIGQNALKECIISDQVAIGYQSLRNATSAWRNTAVGTSASLVNVTGTDNTALGYWALKNNTSNNNTAVGSQALLNQTSGTQNTVLGHNAGLDITTAINNTAVGYRALSENINFNHCTGIGANAQVTGENQVQLGASGTTPYAYAALQLRSDVRDKAEIRDTSLGLEFINSLRAREFKWDLREDYREWDEETQSYIEHEKDGTRVRSRYHQGFIAQEVKAVMDDLGVDFAGYQDHTVNGGKDVLSLGYEEFIAPLVKAVQELNAEVQQLKAQNSRANSLLPKWTSKLKDKG